MELFCVSNVFHPASMTTTFACIALIPFQVVLLLLLIHHLFVGTMN